MRDFVIQVTHRPGELANITNALSLQEVNIKSIAAMTLGNQAALRLIPDDVDAARSGAQSRQHPLRGEGTGHGLAGEPVPANSPRWRANSPTPG